MSATADSSWRTVTLGDVARVATGSRNNQDKSATGAFPFFVRSANVERIDSYSHDCEAILVPGEGKIGSIFHYVNGKFDVHQRVYAITDLDQTMDGRFLFWYMRQFFGPHALEQTVKATVDSLRRPTFVGFTMRVPRSRFEQRRIAAALTDADDLISALERLIVKKEAIKQGMMQELLSGQTRLPEFDGAGHWRPLELRSICEVTMGQSPPSASYNSFGQGLPLVQGGAELAGQRTIDRIWTTAPARTCSAGDVVVTVRAPVGTVARATSKSCLGRGVCALSAPGLNGFLLHALTYAQHSWEAIAQGSTFTAVNSSDVRAFKIPYPPNSNEAELVGSVLDYADDELAALRKRLEKAKAVKQGMMQELLTGRTRLPAEPEQEAEAA